MLDLYGRLEFKLILLPLCKHHSYLQLQILLQANEDSQCISSCIYAEIDIPYSLELTPPSIISPPFLLKYAAEVYLSLI